MNNNKPIVRDRLVFICDLLALISEHTVALQTDPDSYEELNAWVKSSIGDLSYMIAESTAFTQEEREGVLGCLQKAQACLQRAEVL